MNTTPKMKILTYFPGILYFLSQLPRRPTHIRNANLDVCILQHATSTVWQFNSGKHI